MYKTHNIVEQHLRETFHNEMPQREERFLENVNSGSLFGFVEFDIELPENLREAFASFPPVFKNVSVGRDDSGLFMEEYADKECLLT